MGGWGLFFLAAVGVVCGGKKLRLPRAKRPNVTGHSRGPTEGDVSFGRFEEARREWTEQSQEQTDVSL